MIDKPKTLADYTRSVSQTSPLTTADRLQRIETLGKRIDAHVQSICQVGSLNGTSTETTDKAVIAFYEQMVLLERRLGLIQDALKTA
jgi:hypothetical protein